MTFQKRMDAIGKKAVELAKAGTPKEQIRQQIQMQLGAEMGNWMMTRPRQRYAPGSVLRRSISNAAKSSKSSD